MQFLDQIRTNSRVRNEVLETDGLRGKKCKFRVQKRAKPRHIFGQPENEISPNGFRF